MMGGGGAPHRNWPGLGSITPHFFKFHVKKMPRGGGEGRGSHGYESIFLCQFVLISCNIPREIIAIF